VNAVLKRRPIDFEVTTPLGFRFAGNTRDVIQRHVYVFGVWEPDVTAWMWRQVQPGAVVVDVGANVGYFSLLAARLVGDTGVVHAIEPLPSTVRRLRRNVDLNPSRRVTIHDVACSDFEGEMEIFAASADNIGSASTLGGDHSEGRVRCVRLDSILADVDPARISVVKIDTEGGEAAVLRGARKTLAVMEPGAAVLVEITVGADDVWGLMLDAGFDAYAIDNDYRPGRYADRRVREPYRVLEPPTRAQDVVFVKRHAPPSEPTVTVGSVPSHGRA
jgi:FkbM family methyltransferase